MNSRKLWLSALCCAVVLAVGAPRLLRAEEAATAPAADALSPAVREALKGLSAEDFKVREAALKQVQLALGQQIAALVSTDDPEGQARVAALLEFNDGLTRWAIDALKLPDEQRKAQLKWGLTPEVLPILARVFSPDAGKRAEGIKQLAKYDDADVSFLLARLLDDSDRTVYIAAMEAVWDRKPTDGIVNALWNRAVEAGFAIYVPQVVNGGNVMFRGRAVGGAVNYDNMAYRRMQDNQLAVEVLINIKAPQVNEKLKGLFEKAGKALAGGNANNGQSWMYMAQNEPMKNAYRLAEAYKPTALVPVLYNLANAPCTNKSQGQFNNTKYFWSNRTSPLATLVKITEQNPEDYKLKKLSQIGGLWTAPSEADENAALEKLKGWWQKNAEKYGAQAEAEPAADATMPAASQPAAEKGAVRIQQGTVRIQRIQVQGGKVQVEVNGD